MTPILPAEVNGAGLDGAQIQNNQAGPAVVVSAALPLEEKQRLANDAIGIGETLRDTDAQVLPPSRQGDAAYLGGQIGQALSQATTGLLGILSDEHKSNHKDSISSGPGQTMDHAAPAIMPPRPVYHHAPGFGGGPG